MQRGRAAYLEWTSPIGLGSNFFKPIIAIIHSIHNRDYSSPELVKKIDSSLCDIISAGKKRKSERKAEKSLICMYLKIDMFINCIRKTKFNWFYWISKWAHITLLCASSPFLCSIHWAVSSDMKQFVCSASHTFEGIFIILNFDTAYYDSIKHLHLRYVCFNAGDVGVEHTYTHSEIIVSFFFLYI